MSTREIKFRSFADYRFYKHKATLDGVSGQSKKNECYDQTFIFYDPEVLR